MEDKEKVEEAGKGPSFFKKYGSFIHISIVTVVLCGIMIYIMANGG